MNTDFVIIGLPASGKTTYLAALWHLVEAEETACRLRLDSYVGDLAYLNRIAEAWRTFQKVPRTSQIGDVDVTIHLVDSVTGRKGAAFFPDLAGETFDAQVERRRGQPELIENLAREGGVLLFISSDVTEDALSVIELNARLPRLDEVEAEEIVAPAQLSEPAAAKEWEPKLIPAQVRLVQILSDLLRPPFAPCRRRLAVIISAWDLARGMGMAPAAWLAAHMPLVDQFLRTNGQAFEHLVYGVSAQGVSLEDGAAVDRASHLTASRRIQIVGPDGEGNDLTSPLAWLMSLG